MYAKPDKATCPVATYKFFKDRRPEDCCKPSDPFYLAPVTKDKHPTTAQPWFMNQPVGKNKLYSIMKTMISKANIQTDKRLTNTSARKHLCQKLIRHGVSDAQAVQITGN